MVTPQLGMIVDRVTWLLTELKKARPRGIPGDRPADREFQGIDRLDWGVPH
jgi:hypothetical protein